MSLAFCAPCTRPINLLISYSILADDSKPNKDLSTVRKRDAPNLRSRSNAS